MSFHNLFPYPLFCMAVLIVCILINTCAVNSTGIITKNIYTFGMLSKSGFGQETTSFPTPIRNPILESLLLNGNESFKYISDHNSDISVNIDKIADGVYIRLFILSYYNKTNNNSFLGQYIFQTGVTESNYNNVFLQPPYCAATPELAYIYTSDGSQYNQFNNSKIIDISCLFSCIALTSDGRVYGVGHSAGGIWYQLFTNTSYNDPVSGEILTNVKYISVAVGGCLYCETFFAISNYGHVLSIGCNTYGIRGTSGPNENILTAQPRVISSLQNITFLTVGKGSASNTVSFAAAIDSNGKVWTWGPNQKGQLGIGNSTVSYSETPTQITIVDGLKCKTISLGTSHAIATMENGDVYVFGSNALSQSDLTNTGVSIFWSPSNITDKLIAAQKSSTPDMNVTVSECVASGDVSACLVTTYSNNNGSSNHLYTWGTPFYPERYGHSGTSYYSTINITSSINKMSISLLNSFVITLDGYIWTWGDNQYGSLGLGDRFLRYPKKLTVPSLTGNFTISQLISGDDITFLLSKSSNGSTYLDYWGSSSLNKMDFGVTASTPLRAPQSLIDKRLLKFDTQGSAGLALTENGEVYGWGLYDSSSSTLPTLIISSTNSSSTNGGNFRLVSVGYTYLSNSFLLAANNTLWELSSSTISQIDLFGLDNETIIDLKASNFGLYILTSAGNVYGYGSFYFTNTATVFPNVTRLNNDTLKVRKICNHGNSYYFIAISTVGEAYRFILGYFKKIESPMDPYFVECATLYNSYFLISRKGKLYSYSTDNQHFQYSSLKKSSIDFQLYPSGDYFDGIPYLVATQYATTVITREEFACFAINSTDPSACSSHGYCSSPNQCTCDEGYSGTNCSEYSCFGISSTSKNVCSGRGVCSSLDTCSNCVKSNGSYCQTPSCFGIASSNLGVCNGHGNCTNIDKCECQFGYFGEQCQFNSCFGNSNGKFSSQTVADIFCKKINKQLNI